MPAFDPDVPPAGPSADRFRLGPAGIAAVAIGAAIVAAIAVAMFTAQRPGPQSGQANSPQTPITAPAPDASSAAPEDAAAAVAAAESVVQVQMQSGALDEDAGQKLLERLDAVRQEIDEGDLDEAVKKARDVRKELSDSRRKDSLTNAAYGAILASLDDLTRLLSRSDAGDN